MNPPPALRHVTGRALDLVGDVDTFVDEHRPACYGCGRENPHGLGIRPRLEGRTVVAPLVLGERFQGAPGVAHGGVVASVLDDLLGFVPFACDRLAVTAQLELFYRAPVPTGLPLVGMAWLAKDGDHKLWAEGCITGEDGTVLTEAAGLFVVVPESHFEKARA